MLNPVAPERELQVAGSTVLIRRQGIGVPVLVAPSDIGSPGWSEFHEALSQSHDVIAVDLPGFNALHSAEWIRHPRDLAALLGLTLDKLGVGEALVVGVGFGGWLAAELATFAQGRLAGLVLVNPMGLKPREGEIFDQFLVGHEDYVRRGFQDADRFTALYGASADIDQLIKWDHAREMTSRVAWKPYMFNHALAHLIQGIQIPTLIVAGENDEIVPASASRQYAEAIAGAGLETIPAAGHWLDLEKPDDLAQLIKSFQG